MAFFVISQSKINFFALGAYKLKFSGYAYVICMDGLTKPLLLVKLRLNRLTSNSMVSQ